MPEEIENYVHRIGRTGRCGKTGVATTFINKSQDETILRDLKLLLKEARQRIPPVLAALEDEPLEVAADGTTKGCQYETTHCFAFADLFSCEYDIPLAQLSRMSACVA